MCDKQPPWIEHPNIWKTRSAFMSFLRGGIRRALWNRSPIKLEFIKQNRRKIKNPNPKGKVETVWGGTCALTGLEFPLNQLEVDHVVGNHSLNNLEDIQSFIENIVLVSFDDLQFVSKDAHRIKSYADKNKISFLEATYHKTAIELQKSKKDKEWLKQRGLNPASNADRRREQIIGELKNESNGTK